MINNNYYSNSKKSAMNSNQVLDFIDGLNSSDNNIRHIILLHEEVESARPIQFKFLKNGLDNGQQCIFASCEAPDFLAQSFSHFGIDIKRYKERDLIRIHQLRWEEVEDIERGDDDYLKTLMDLLGSQEEEKSRIINKQQPAARITVSHSISLEKTNHIKSIFDFESACKSYYDHHSLGSKLCCYHVDDLNQVFERPWMGALLKNHQGVIYVPKFSNGVALNIS